MKRHEQLQDLSREHHLALKLALLARRALESGAAPQIQAAATTCATAFVSDLEPHFVREESDVLPLLAQAGEIALVERTLNEHDEMRRLAAQLALPAADPARGRFRRALLAIVIADVSMSLDNVLAVAGAAREHVEVLVFGLALSIALMGVAANLIAGVMDRYRWIAYVGVALVAYVSADIIWRGSLEVATQVQAAMP